MMDHFSTSEVDFPILRCPRCGYELRGVVESWHETCPMRSTCSECGYDIDWSHYFRGRATAPRRNIEFASRVWLPGPFVRTLFGQFRPRRTWNTLRLEHPVQPKRLAVYVGWLVLTIGVGWYLAWLSFAAFWVEFYGQWTVLGSMRSLILLWLEYAVMPLSQKSGVTLSYSDGSTGTAVPAIEALKAWLTFGGTAWYQRWWAMDLLLGIGGMLLLTACWLIALASTPQWMRSERILPAHYLRLGVYALSFGVINRVATASIFLLPWVVSIGWIDDRAVETVQSIAFGLIFLIAFPWWYFVCRDYLGLKQPLRVAVAVHLFGFVVPLAVLGTINSYFAIKEITG